MQAHHQFTFLQEKITDLGSAIFFNQSDSLLKLPTSIITCQRVDEFGFIWFYMQKPSQHISEFEKEFPVRLDFFRKGKDYFLQVTGKASLVADPEELNAMELSFEEKIAAEQMVLVKVKMLKADYHETHSSTRASWWQSAIHYVHTWFRSSNGNFGREIFHPAS